MGGTNTFSGGFTLTSGTVKTANVQALGTTAGTLNLNGGTLDLENGFTFPADPISAYNTVVGGNVTIKSGVASGTTGNQYLFGTLSIGADTLTADKGSNVTSGYRVQFGAVTLTGNATLDAENGAFLVVGAGGGSAGLSGNFNLTVQSATTGTGAVSVRGGVNGGTRTSGVTTFASGNNNINGSGGTTILGTTGTTLALNGGSLDLQTTVSSILAYNTTVGGNFTLTANNNTAFTQTLGTLSIGTFNLTTAGMGTTGTNNIAFGPTTLTGNATFNVTNGTSGATSTLTLGALNDGGAAKTITKGGASTLVLNAATTNLIAIDQINISAGNLSVTNATALGTVAGTGVTVDVADGTVFNVGAATLAVGALTNTTGTHAANTGSVTLGANTLTIGSAGTNLSGTFGGVISGTGGITKAGSGMETFSGANSYSGATTLNAGTLTGTQTSGTPFGTGNVVLNGGTLSLAQSASGANVVTGANTAAATTFTYGGGATLQLTKNGTSLSYTIGNTTATANSVLSRAAGTNGTLVLGVTALSNLQSSEQFIVNGESVAANKNGASSSAGIYDASMVAQDSATGGSFVAADIAINGGFKLAAYTTHSGSTFTTAANEIADVTTANTITDGGGHAYAMRVGAVAAALSGTVTINGNASSSTNSGIAGLILNPTATASTISGGTLAFGSSEPAVYVSSGAGGGSISSAMTGTAGLTKFGPGTLSLSGSNTGLTGAINVNQGTLRANSTIGITTTTVSVNSGGTLGGNGTIANTAALVTVKSGGTIAAGNGGNATDSTNIGKLTTGAESWSAGGIYSWKINSVGATGAVDSITNAGGIAGTNWDSIAMSALTVPTSGFTIAPVGTLTGVANGHYNWIIAQDSGTLTGASVSPGTNVLGSLFTLDTSNLSVNGGADPVASSAFTLEFLTDGSNKDLVLSYNAAPEPGTAMLVLAGVVPMLSDRRRRTKQTRSAK